MEIIQDLISVLLHNPEIMNHLESVTSTDKQLKEAIADFKDNLNNLDDDIFIETIEESDINLGEFDNLLNKDEFTLLEGVEVISTIKNLVDSISSKIDEKVKDLKELKSKFNTTVEGLI